MTVAHAVERRSYTLKSEATQLRKQGAILEALDKFESRLKFLSEQKADRVTIRNAKTELADALNNAVMIYAQHGTHEELVRKLLSRAEDLLQAADSIKMTDMQRTLLSTTYNNMACHLKRCKKPHAAVQYLHKALELEAERPGCCDAADSHINLCVTLSDLGRHEEAINHCQAALVLLQDELFNADPPPPPAKGDDHALSIVTEQNTNTFKARATVLAVCYYNIGVEQEFLGRPG